MARPRLEESNPQLVMRALELSMQMGIKPAAAAVGISKNTLRRLLRENDLNDICRMCAIDRKIMRNWGRRR